MISSKMSKLSKISKLSNLKLIDPYQPVSNLDIEYVEDQIIKEIQTLTNYYLQSGFEIYSSHYSKDDILVAYNFLVKKGNELDELRENFGLSNSPSLFTRIGHGLDLCTIIEDVRNYDKRSIIYNLHNDIESGIDIISTLFNIVNKIMSEYPED